MSQNDLRLHIFIFILRVALFVMTGIALHETDRPLAREACPSLWEMTTGILCIKCIRLTICPLLFHYFQVYEKYTEFGTTIMYAIFFVVECIVTSQSLNSAQCVSVTSAATGYPMLVFVSFTVCVYDGAYVLSNALYRIVKRF